MPDVRGIRTEYRANCCVYYAAYNVVNNVYVYTTSAMPKTTEEDERHTSFWYVECFN